MSKNRRPRLCVEVLECRLAPATSHSIGTFQIVDKTASPVWEWKTSPTADVAGSVVGTDNLMASIDVQYTLTGKDLTMATKIGDRINGENVEWRNVGQKVPDGWGGKKDKVISGVKYNLGISPGWTGPTVTGVIQFPVSTTNNAELAPGTNTAHYHGFLLAHDKYGPEQWTHQIDLTSAAGLFGGTKGVDIRPTSANVFVTDTYLALGSPALPALAAGQRYRIVSFDALDQNTFTFTTGNTTGLGLFAAASDALITDADGYLVLDPSTTLAGVFPTGSQYAGAYADTNKDLVARDDAGQVYLLSGYAYSAVPPGLSVLPDGQTAVVPGDLVLPGTDALWLTFNSPSGGAGFVIFPDSPPPLPKLTVSDASVTEGNSGTTYAVVTVSLSAPATAPVRVSYTVTPGTASAPSDFTASTGTLTFLPGQTTQTIAVPVNGDTVYEPNEDFFVDLGSAVGATVADGTGTGTIVNDDPLPSAAIAAGSPSVPEGDSGTTPYMFTVTLSNPSSQTITVDYATADGTATAGSDYTAASGTLTFAPGETQKTVNVAVTGDTLNEPDETFTVTLSSPANASVGTGTAIGTIANDDGPPQIRITSVVPYEGDSGTTVMVFNVWLSAASGQAVTVDYTTADGTATAGSDYQATSGTLTFAPGETQKTISVVIYGDTTVEPDEYFSVLLSNPVHATLSTSTANGGIMNDD